MSQYWGTKTIFLLFYKLSINNHGIFIYQFNLISFRYVLQVLKCPYRRLGIPLNERCYTCTLGLCNNNQVDNEMHFYIRMPRSNTFKFFELLSTLKLKKLKNSFYLYKKFFNQSALLEHLYFFLIFSLICTVHVPLTLYLHL